jgi:hypothetical protein
VSLASTGLNVRRTGAVDDDCPLTVTLTNDLSEDARSPDHPRDVEVFEIFTTALIAIAALATARSGYQDSLWDSIQSSNYTQASAARTNAAQKHTEANQHRLAESSRTLPVLPERSVDHGEVAAS